MAQLVSRLLLYHRGRQLIQLSRHRDRALHGDYSFAGEADHLLALCTALDLRDGYVVDIAASDGVTQSCTLPFFRNAKWSGLAVEMDAEKFAKLAYAYAGFQNVRLAKCRVVPGNIAALLVAYEVPTDFSILNLDIDSYDLFVICAMLQAGFRPKIITMEINEKLPPPLFFTVKYSPEWYWKGDHFYGCSATAAAETVKPFGYIIESIKFNNIFFVRGDLAAGKIKDVPTEVAYESGYRNRPDRKKLFPYNEDVDKALDMSPTDAADFFNNFFEKYRGRYELEVRNGLSPWKCE